MHTVGNYANFIVRLFVIYVMNKNCILLICTLLCSCSMVSHLPHDELLYVGTLPTKVEDDTYAPLRDQAIDKAKVAFLSPPNNALFGSSRYRTPFPIGLWAYNAFTGDSTGLRHWLFKTFASQPIFISTVNPTLRANVAENTLRNYGYFDSHVEYKVDTLPDRRKARLSYTMYLKRPWRYGNIKYTGFTPSMDSLIRSTWSDRLLREGEQVSFATLSSERNRLFTLFREKGYYYFRPEMISILADTIATKGTAQLRITPHLNLPTQATTPWYIGHTYITIRERMGKAQSDTLKDYDITFIYEGKHIPIRRKLLTSRLAYRQGELYSSTAQNETQRDLNRLGVFNAVSINYIPRDSTSSTDTLDAHINTLLEYPYEVSLESNFTAKSNNQIGPGIVASISRKNLLRLAEIIQFKLKGSYEWQTERALRHESSAINSFEVGSEASLSVPILLFPGGYDYSYHRPVSTTARLYAEWLNRGGYFRMLAFGGNLTYAFSTSTTLVHSTNPFSLTFNTLEYTTQRFDSIMTANPAIGLSFRDQFIPSSSYTITYDNTSLKHRHPTRGTMSFTSAGAATSLIYAAIGNSFNKKGKSLMGTPYAQFIKGHIEACRYYHLSKRQTLATRLIIGAIYAYGNSTVPPFSEQFHMGGANDLRAFPLRSIGPGSYHSSSRYAYIDHSGDFKLEANIEWRFPLVKQLHGALFMDAGNIWLWRNDLSRPGAELRWATFGNDIALGTGIGLRYNLKVLLLRCDVGIPLHAPYHTGRNSYYNIPHFGRGLCLHFGVGYPF